MVNLTSFVLFHFSLELLGIFMVMINIVSIVKVEYINATENRLPNIFSVKNFNCMLLSCHVRVSE